MPRCSRLSPSERNSSWTYSTDYEEDSPGINRIEITELAYSQPHAITIRIKDKPGVASAIPRFLAAALCRKEVRHSRDQIEHNGRSSRGGDAFVIAVRYTS